MAAQHITQVDWCNASGQSPAIAVAARTGRDFHPDLLSRQNDNFNCQTLSRYSIKPFETQAPLE
jgi:hypothetical protein